MRVVVFLMFICLIFAGLLSILDTQESEVVRYALVVGMARDGDGRGRLKNSSFKSRFYDKGVTVTVEAIAAADGKSRFIGWYDELEGGRIVSADRVYTFKLERDRGLYARFITDSFEVKFEDPILDRVVRELVDWRVTRLTYGDVKTISKLVYNGYNSEYVITNLGGLECLTALSELDIQNNRVVDLMPLITLKSLKVLNLEHNRVADISPLANLSSLQTIYLSYNEVVDLRPLTELSSLTTLYLNNNRIIDTLPLEELKALDSLYLSSNPVADIRLLER